MPKIPVYGELVNHPLDISFLIIQPRRPFYMFAIRKL
jgi:hypothetical protein